METRIGNNSNWDQKLGHADPGPQPLLTVVIPVFNEEKTIDELIRRVLAAPYEKQVVIVDDGSSDGTADILRTWSILPGIVVIHHTVNQGKGRAIRTGLEAARGRYTIIQDADLEYEPRDYTQLITGLQSGSWDVVFGSRYLNGTGENVSFMFRMGVRLLNWTVRVLYGLKLTDEATCYKATSTAILRRMDLQCERFEFCPELVAKACRMGLRITEVPVSYEPRGATGGKKIRLRDGWFAMQALWRWRKWTDYEIPTVEVQTPVVVHIERQVVKNLSTTTDSGSHRQLQDVPGVLR